MVADVPLDEARRGYAVGTEVLQAILSAHDGPTAVVPVEPDEEWPETIREHDPTRVLTLGSDCATSVAPFACLADRYGDDLAIDSDEAVFGLGVVPGGLSGEAARRIVADPEAAADVVGLTIAEFVPRQVIRLQRILRDVPLTGRSSPGQDSNPQIWCRPSRDHAPMAPQSPR
jgi:hypothetical protein